MASNELLEAKGRRTWRQEMAVAVSAAPAPPSTSHDLAEFWLLQGVPDAPLGVLAAVCQEQRLLAGEVIFREGDAADGLYLISSGTVRIITHAANGDALLASVGAGDCFGELGVIDGTARSATAIAGTFTVVQFVPTEPFLDVLEQVPLVSLKLVALLSERLRRTNRLVADLPSSRINRTSASLED